MSRMDQLTHTPEYAAMQKLLKERKELEHPDDSGLFFLGIIGIFIKEKRKKERKKRLQEIERELEQYSGLMRQIEEAEQEEMAEKRKKKAEERKKMVEAFPRSKYGQGHIIVYGRATRLYNPDAGQADFDAAKGAHSQKFGSNNGWQFKSNFPAEEFVATIYVDGEPVARTDKETVFYKIPVSPGAHTVSLSGYGQLSVGGRARFDDAAVDGTVDVATGSKFVMFDLKIQGIAIDKPPRAKITVTDYDDFGLFAEDVEIDSISELEK